MTGLNGHVVEYLVGNLEDVVGPDHVQNLFRRNAALKSTLLLRLRRAKRSENFRTSKSSSYSLLLDDHSKIQAFDYYLLMVIGNMYQTIK